MKILTVDLQNDFASEDGVYYQTRPCVPFIRDIFLPLWVSGIIPSLRSSRTIV
jgi:hypothetical protein